MNFVKEGRAEQDDERRQKEWERVRTKEDPVEAPEEVFDNRSLYDKLKEQHDIKKREHDDTYSLKNSIRGIDSEEVDFLSECDRQRAQRERAIRLEERKDVLEMKEAFKESGGGCSALPITTVKVTVPHAKKENKQAKLLSHGLIVNSTSSKRKHTSDTNTTSDNKTTTATTTTTKTTTGNTTVDSSKSSPEKKMKTVNRNADSDSDSDEDSDLKKKQLKVYPVKQYVLGVLPGIGEYSSGNSSDSSGADSEASDDEIEARGPGFFGCSEKSKK